MRKGVRHTLKLVALGMGFCAITGQISVAAAASLSHGKPKNFTEIRLITPFTVEGLNPKVTITKRIQGDCWTTSTTNSSRPNTWRCQADQKIYDPCFVNPIKPESSVICLSDPWSNKAVEITLNSPLPSTKNKSFDHKSAQPWALELANGNHCTLITGPSLFLAGLKTNYKCKSAVVVGDIDRAGTFWTVYYLAHNSLSMNQAHVKAAWY